MALELGELVGYLDLDDSKFNRKLTGAQKGIGGFASSMGKVVGAGALVAGAAVGAFAVNGLKQFSSFEKGMNEVFTLLPGMSQEAMGALQDDTRKFVREMGVAHDEAVPALYSALSAGVPQANVFDFMEVAAKAAKGGVTDLNTAVDGISSVVNSYGDSISGAGEASDLMFTAVRLGKTTFDELSASLFQVNPTAAALGVGFDEVTASLAVMTAQGVPTSVATTQLRQAMVELSKEGGKTADLFQEVAGKTFKDFIAEGGNTGEALQLLADYASETGVGVSDLFGSVEAGNAALALTGKNSEKFNTALDEMRSSAGATDAAFETMDRGLARSWERIKVGASDAAIGLGQTLAPAVASMADWFLDALPVAIDKFTGAISKAQEAASLFWAGLTMDSGTRAQFAGELDGLVLVGSNVRAVFDEMVVGFNAFGEAWRYNDGEIMSSGFPGFMERIGYYARQTFDYVKGTVIPALQSFGEWVVKNKDWLGALVIGLGAGYAAFKTLSIISTVVGFIKAFSVATQVAAAKQWLLNGAFAASGIGLVIIGVSALVAGLVYFFTQTETGRKIVETAWNGIKSAAKAVADWFTGTLVPNVTSVVTSIGNKFSDLYTKYVKPAVDGVGAIFNWLYNKVIKPVFDMMKWAADTWWTVTNGIFQVAIASIKNILAPAFSNWWTGTIKPVFDAAAEKVKTWWTATSTIFTTVATYLKNTLGVAFTVFKDLVVKVFGDSYSAISTAWTNIKSTFSTIDKYLRETLGPVFTWLWEKAISPAWTSISDKITGVWKDYIKPAFTALKDGVEAIPTAFTAAKDGIGRAWDAIKEKVKSPIRAVIGFINEGLIDKFNVIPGVKIGKVNLPPGFADGGYTGDGGKYEAAGVVHKGEYVFTKEQTAALGRENLANAARNAIRGGAATNGEGNMGGFFEGNAANVRRHGAYYMNVAAGMGGWNFPAAARIWDGAAGVKVKIGRGNLQGQVTQRERGGGILGYTTGNNIDMSPSWMGQLGATQRRTVAAHEIGHALGLPHNSSNSIMQPNLQNMASVPTALDIRNLQTLFPGGTGKAGDGSVSNPFDGIVDWITDKVKKAFPEGGMFVDAAGGLAKQGIGQVVKWITDIKDGVKDLAGDVVGKVKDFFGGGGAAVAPTVYDGGGMLYNTGGPQLIQHNKKKPDRVFSDEQYQVLMKAAFKEPVVVYSKTEYLGDNPEQFADRERRRMLDTLNAYA